MSGEKKNCDREGPHITNDMGTGECIKCYNLAQGNSPKNRGYWTLCKAFNRIRNWVSLFSKHQIAITISLVASPLFVLCHRTIVCGVVVGGPQNCVSTWRLFTGSTFVRSLATYDVQHRIYWGDTFHAHGCPSQLFHGLNTYEKCGWFLNPVPEQSWLSFSIWSFLILVAHAVLAANDEASSI